MKRIIFIGALLCATIGFSQASIGLIKVGAFNDLNNNGSAEVGESITWTFSLLNNGTVDLTNIMVFDPDVTVMGGPIDLVPGNSDVTSFTATYSLLQQDIDDGNVINQATVEGTLSGGSMISDLSDDSSYIENDPTIVTLPISGPLLDALVFFEDKENVAASIADPITIMTQDAIDRKAMHDTPIDERDVPVTEAYIISLKSEPGITVFSKSKWMNSAYVRGSQTDIENLVALAYVSSVEFADKSLNSFADIQPTPDKFAMEQEPTQRIVYNYGATLNQTEQIAAEVLHQNDFTGDGMVVAVLDSGFPNFATIPAFSDIINEGRLLGTYDFEGRQENVTGTGSHGTRTSSDIGGFIDGDFVGTAPDASFYLFRTEFSPSENPVEEAWWVEALERADSLGVDVVNTSLGYQDYDNPAYDHSYEDLDGKTTIAARGANHAFDKGMLLVTSAGNDGGGFTFVATPADAPGVLTVGAVDEDGNYVSFSSIGPTTDGRIKPDVMAKGASAAVINQDGDVTTSSGTSFSSPIMAGAVTSLWQANPEATNAQVMQIVRESAHLFANPTDEMGYGIPNFGDALAALQLLSVEEQLLKTQFAVYPNPVEDRLFISFPQHLSVGRVSVYSILGNELMQQDISTQKNSIELSHLSKGVYLVSITSEATTNTFKILKQ